MDKAFFECSDELISAVIGAAKATVNDMQADEDTYRIIIEALSVINDINCDVQTLKDLTRKVRTEKAKLAPGCADCPAQCERNSDHDMNALWNTEENVRAVKLMLLSSLKETAVYLRQISSDSHLSEEVGADICDILFKISLDLDIEKYLPTVTKAGEINLKCRTLLEGKT